MAFKPGRESETFGKNHNHLLGGMVLALELVSRWGTQRSESFGSKTGIIPFRDPGILVIIIFRGWRPGS
jgi:hypothetical protein